MDEQGNTDMAPPKSPASAAKISSDQTPPQSPKRPTSGATSSPREKPSSVKDLQEKLLAASSSSSPKTRESSPTKTKKNGSPLKKSGVVESQQKQQPLLKKKSNVKLKKPELTSGNDTGSKPEPEPEPQPAVVHGDDDVKVKQDIKQDTDLVTEQPPPEPVLEPVSNPALVSESVSNPEPPSEPVSDLKPALDLVSESGPPPEPASESVPNPEPPAEPISEPVSISEPAAPEPVSEPEPEPPLLHQPDHPHKQIDITEPSQDLPPPTSTPPLPHSTETPDSQQQESLILPFDPEKDLPTKKDDKDNAESDSKSPLKPSKSESETPPHPPPKSRAPFSWLKGSTTSSPKRPNSNSPTRKQSPSSSSSLDREPPPAHLLSIDNYELIQNRATTTLKAFNQLTPPEIQCIQQGLETLRVRYEDIKDNEPGSPDWSIWTSAVNDYQGLAAESPAALAQSVACGIPPSIRGLIWQIQARSKSRLLEETYSDLLTQLSPHEKAIRKDISRTPLFRIANSESLFNLLKAYSLYDPEVGYTQGMAFITVPILINNGSEPEAFSLLVTLMKNYDLRDLYTVEMPGLQVKLYQYDRILEDTVPELHLHLQRQGIRSSMYASQWILTLFAYKFPLEIIVRIFDTVVAEGLASVLRFAVALMKANREKILMLEFDPLLNFLKDRLFDVYLTPDQHGVSQHHTFANLLRTNNSTSYDNCSFEVDQLVKDAFAVKLFPKTLNKYQAEYTEIHRLEKERRDEIDNLRSTNSQLTTQVRKLEESLGALNREHVEVANNMIQGKVQIAKLEDELEQLKAENRELSAVVAGYRKEPPIEKAEMDRLLQRNLEVMDINRNLEDQLSALEQELATTKTKVANLESENGSIKGKWNDIRKILE